MEKTILPTGCEHPQNKRIEIGKLHAITKIKTVLHVAKDGKKRENKIGKIHRSDWRGCVTDEKSIKHYGNANKMQFTYKWRNQMISMQQFWRMIFTAVP